MRCGGEYLGPLCGFLSGRRFDTPFFSFSCLETTLASGRKA